MITATFDFTTGWLFSGAPATDFSISFSDNNSDRVYPTNLRFGYTLIINNIETDIHAWPPDNIIIRELTPQRVFNYRTAAQPENEITLSVWAENAGVFTEDETTWVIPRPAQPHPSWLWTNGVWQAPIPYPENTEGIYQWNESTQSWDEVSTS